MSTACTSKSSRPCRVIVPGAVVADGVPVRQQFGVLLVKFVFEPAEGAPALQGAAEAAAGALVADLVGEVGLAVDWAVAVDWAGVAA